MPSELSNTDDIGIKTGKALFHYQKIRDIFRSYYKKVGVRIGRGKSLGEFGFGFRIPFDFKRMELSITLLQVIYLLLLFGAPKISVHPSPVIVIAFCPLRYDKVFPLNNLSSSSLYKYRPIISVFYHRQNTTFLELKP